MFLRNCVVRHVLISLVTRHHLFFYINLLKLMNNLQESVHLSEEMHNGTQNASKDHVGITSNGSTDESSVCTNTDLCKRALFDVLISTKFAELCDLLFGNFQGMKINSLFDFSLISSRIKEGAYESSPMLFHSDIQQVSFQLYSLSSSILLIKLCASNYVRYYGGINTLPTCTAWI